MRAPGPFLRLATRTLFWISRSETVKISNVILKPAAILAISLGPALLGAWAQTPAVSAGAPPSTMGGNAVSHTTKAMNYRRTGGSAKISFQGTKLMPTAGGDAEVK